MKLRFSVMQLLWLTALVAVILVWCKILAFYATHSYPR